MESQQNLTPLVDGIIHSLVSTSKASDAFLIAGAPPTVRAILEGTLPPANIIHSGQEHMILNGMVNSQHGSTFNDQLADLRFGMPITSEQAATYSLDPWGLKVYRCPYNLQPQ